MGCGRGVWGGGCAPSPEKNSFLRPQNNNFGAFWHVFLSLIGATTGCKTHFLCHTTYCECLKTITQPIRPTIQWIKPKISGNINFADNFSIVQYEHRFSVAVRLCYAIRIVKLCMAEVGSYCICIINVMHYVRQIHFVIVTCCWIDSVLSWASKNLTISW